MKLLNYLLLLFSLTLISCTENTSPEEDYIIFEVVKIDDRDIEEYKEIHSDAVYPIEFRLTEPIEEFSGTVVLENFGAKDIKKFFGGDVFKVDINYQIKGVEYIIFNEIEVDSATIKGVYWFSGSTIDSRPSDFLAVKK